MKKPRFKRCQGKPKFGFHFNTCPRKGVVKRSGKLYCRECDPTQKREYAPVRGVVL
jgi:hypothetical protein